MRMDEYQKWLDEQFLDVTEPAQNSTVKTAEAPAAPAVEHIERPQSSLLFEGTAVVEQIQPVLQEEPEPVLPPLPEPRPVHTFSARDAALDDSDVPSIENYLPFLRSPREPA